MARKSAHKRSKHSSKKSFKSYKSSKVAVWFSLAVALVLSLGLLTEGFGVFKKPLPQSTYQIPDTVSDAPIPLQDNNTFSR